MYLTPAAILTTLVAVAAAAGPVPIESRQVSPCVEACMQALGIFDGHARQLCTEQCGEVKKREPAPAPVAIAAVEERQISPGVQTCMDDLGIYDGHAISFCRRECGEQP